MSEEQAPQNTKGSKIVMMNSMGQFNLEQNTEIDILKAKNKNELDFGLNIEEPEASFYDLQFELCDAKIRLYSNGKYVIYGLKSEAHKRKVDAQLKLTFERFIRPYIKPKN